MNVHCSLLKHPATWVPRHHGMARPQAENGGGGLQMWRVAANILNKQSRTAWGLGVGLTTPHRKK
jgi:hypothetical protein